ncbi:hypothetical protein TNCV_2448031 [Trichonephila clavipes]|uniref:Uncharacterized protein n=1 Tax=Trichonephila clavipes TaxID=2585209 RepID=A0A8X6SP40_TRICX|nr:hypothetical protein TNCV_2448031 [Trichonephila clavipes]
MLNDDEIVTSMQEECYPVDDEMDENEDNNESSKGPSNVDTFSALDTAIECVRFHILPGSHSVFGYPNNRCIWSQLIRINDVLLYKVAVVYDTLVATVQHLTAWSLLASDDNTSTPDLFECVRQFIARRCWLCYHLRDRNCEQFQ